MRYLNDLIRKRRRVFACFLPNTNEKSRNYFRRYTSTPLLPTARKTHLLNAFSLAIPLLPLARRIIIHLDNLIPHSVELLQLPIRTDLLLEADLRDLLLPQMKEPVLRWLLTMPITFTVQVNSQAPVLLEILPTSSFYRASRVIHVSVSTLPPLRLPSISLSLSSYTSQEKSPVSRKDLQLMIQILSNNC